MSQDDKKPIDARGEKNKAAKLTDDDVREIRRLYADDDVQITQTELAEKFGVTQGMISSIIHRNSWAHLDAEEDDNE